MTVSNQPFAPGDNMAAPPAPSSSSNDMAVGLPEENLSSLAHYDLTEKMSPYWDLHLLLFVLDYLGELRLYPSDVIAKIKVGLLTKADMIDYLIEQATEANIPIQPEWEARRSEVMNLTKQYEAEVNGFVEALSAYSEDKQMEDDAETGGRITIAKLHERYSQEGGELSFSLTAHEVLLAQCRHIYRTGDYLTANHYLNVYIEGVCDLTSDGWTFESKFSALWGSLSSALLVAVIVPERDEAMTDEEWSASKAMRSALGAESAVQRLFDIDAMLDQPNNPMEKKEIRLQRVWLLHWTVWVLFRIFLDPAVVTDQPEPEVLLEKKQRVLDFFFQARNIAIAQLLAPHLFRYYAVALIVFKRKQEIQAVLNGVTSAATKINDPFVSLLASAHEVTSFAESRKFLSACLSASRVDFFLFALESQIAEQSRMLIFESYCNMHSAIDLNALAEKLALDPQEAERWIVNLIRTARLDAKIDSAKNRVVIFADQPNVYQQVLEKTQPLFVKSQYILTKKHRAPKERA